MKHMGLTPRQNEVLALIEAAERDSRPAPSFDEIMTALGLKSKSGVHRILTALEERGAIHRLRRHRRAIALGRDRNVCCPHCKGCFRLAEHVARPK